MKFEEESLIDYLVKNLEPLTEANPVILAKYVVALLKKDKPLKELQKLCTDNLVEFLGNGAKPFTTKLFQVLEKGSIIKLDNESQQPEPSQPSIIEEIHPPINSSPKQDNPSTSQPSSDSENQEISEDDDDDDRNHKHRRREEAQPNPLETDSQDQFVKKYNKRRNKPYDNGQEYNPTSERKNLSNFDKHRSNFTPHFGPRTRFSQPARFDLSTPIIRPIGRGRGRGPWNQHDPRFNSHETLDFASHTSLFAGTNTQSSSWAGFGFIAGMPNGLMDPLNPLGLPGALRPTINPPLNIGMPRQRCRDFEERGFCLRGDMCPMEHGLNRIVVEDVQSLSQFNLPVSIPSSHGLGIQSASGTLPPSQLASSKSIPNKSIKSGAMDDSSHLNNIPSTSTGNDADVYDPDQPLWNNDIPSAPTALLRRSSTNTEEEPSYDGNAASLNTNSSIWGRIGFKNKSDVVKKEDNEEAVKNTQAFNQGKGIANIEIGSKASMDSGNKNGKALFPKALRTLYVHGIPQKTNRKDALISHFQKFGEVIDIYIPLNGEKAFVQFSKREEAEAALNSPDAVMGNRFIKLSWANRDRIFDNGHNSGQNKSIQSSAFKHNIANGGKSTVPVSNQKSNIPAGDTSIPAVGPVKNLMSNAPKASAPTQKKMENLELLEELRKKQESLAKKRDEFRRQLEEYARQAVPNKKGDVISEQAAKKQKVDAGSPSIKAANRVSEKKLEKNVSEEVVNSNGSKTNPTILQKVPKNIYQTSPIPVPLPNKYKLDNRSTSFRILPPLPADFANVAALKDHFSHYGVITSVVLEDPDHIESNDSTNCEKCSARITFANRQSAEKAYLRGRSWEGHNLIFKWLTGPQNISCDCGTQEIASNVPAKTSQSTEAKKLALECSHYSERITVLPESLSKSPKDSPQSSLAILSSAERPLESSDALMVGINGNSAL